ncbi:acyl-CoA dehydrogenase family protein [Roseomonas genomospecies 6]|uniref:Acyl-CoA dehydrogenase n=1 Tax=Roseomonas genomospecies 6 TaxID=214106 RepID=A0A9W7NJL1_9PROT|nr:acyl-CoA dehydrogenase family protein [Roseomonas genomospecies 6]KAA0680605.1 acyl-CoA dehydrogenase [Roseomonas genomospecies 6]
MIEWNDEQRGFQEAFTRWHADLSADHIDLDRRGGFAWEKWDLIRQSGILRLPFDEEWGGMGQDLLTTMGVLENLGYGCRNGGLNFSVSTHIVSAGIPIQRFGSRALKERFLPRICDGAAIGAHAITEPGSGSDAMSMRTKAVADGDHYVLNGSKTFVSNGPVAEQFVVYARTNPALGAWGVTAFVVERGTPGLTVGQPIEKMGLRNSPLCELFFDDCRIPAADVIGKPGLGFSILDYVMKWEILCSFVINVGEMQHRLERCVEYARSRRQFNQPIGSFQSVANKIVDMKIGMETARNWLYGTAQRFLANGNVTVDIAVAKLLASESNFASAASAVQIFGGNGYMTEYGLEKDMRNATAGTIYSGTSEIQRSRIAKMLGL